MRDQILDGTERLLGRLGYQKTTMDDIALEAGVGRRSIYIHFDSKEAVALGTIDRIVERLLERLESLAHADLTNAERLRGMLAERVLFRFDSVRGYSTASTRSSDRCGRACAPCNYFQSEAALFAKVLQAGQKWRIDRRRSQPARAPSGHSLLPRRSAPANWPPQRGGSKRAANRRAVVNGLMAGIVATTSRDLKRRAARAQCNETFCESEHRLGTNPFEMEIPMKAIIGGLFLIAFVPAIPAQGHLIIDGDQPDAPVAAKTTGKLIEAVANALHDEYVFPDVAKKMAIDLRQRFANTEYEQVTSSRALARKLNEQLQAISKDKHLRVNYVVNAPFGRGGRGRPSPEEEAKMRERMQAQAAANNFGFQKVERLEGNVGYIDLRQFAPAEMAGDTAAAAMGFVANTDALIIDVRKNGGGAPSMVALLCSYLFGPEPKHLNDLYFRPSNSTHQWWTLPYLPGKRFEGKPVYVLTSNRTFSAAEEFTYNLKTQKRATIVGETTGGGANPGGMRAVSEHFMIFVPSGRAINPITKTNWEETGVKPDVPTTAELALKTAHLKALQTIVGNSSESTGSSKKPVAPERLQNLKKEIERLEKELATTASK